MAEDTANNQANSQAGGNQGEQEKTPTWFEQVSAEVRNNPQFKETFGKMAKLDDLVKSHLEIAEKAKATEGMVKIPAEDAPDEEYEKFLQAIGVPKSPDEYKFEEITDVPKGFHLSKEDDVWWADTAYEVGLLPGQAEAIRKAWYDHMLTAYKSALDAMEKAEKDAMEALKKEWGKDAVKNGELAHRALSTFGGEELVTLLKQAGLDNHTAIIKTFYNIGKSIGEDRLARGLPREKPGEYTLEDLYPTMKGLVGARKR